jgi:phage baseplate assembly protein W
MIDLMPATTASEIAQNLRMITNTPVGSIPLDRGFGIDRGMVDQPGTRSQALLNAEVIDTVPRLEPRVTINKVTMSGDSASGQYTPNIDYTITEG